MSCLGTLRGWCWLSVRIAAKACFQGIVGNGELSVNRGISLLGFHAVQCIRSVPMFFAKRLYKSMKVNGPFSLVPNCVFTDRFMTHHVFFFFLSDRLMTNLQLPHYPNLLSLSHPGPRHSRQHPHPDHDFPLWNRHIGHPRVLPFKIWEVPL